jgi:hypothetical protein
MNRHHQILLPRLFPIRTTCMGSLGPSRSLFRRKLFAALTALGSLFHFFVTRLSGFFARAEDGCCVDVFRVCEWFEFTFFAFFGFGAFDDGFCTEFL